MNIASLSHYLTLILPPRSSDPRDQLVYHHPRPLVPISTPISHLILSITPTSGVYAALSRTQRQDTLTALFLHRPWKLDRKRIPRNVIVFSSHFRFDEVLTVGYNPWLAGRLGGRVDGELILSGYKEDEERRIGMVSVLERARAVEGREMVERIRREFWYEEGEEVELCGFGGISDVKPIKVVALMNAFDAELMERVLGIVMPAGSNHRLIDSPSELLYITGEPKDEGLQKAKELGISVICVGHRRCEEWGIRQLSTMIAADLRIEDSATSVETVLEGEEITEEEKIAAEVRRARKREQNARQEVNRLRRQKKDEMLERRRLAATESFQNQSSSQALTTDLNADGEKAS